MNETLELFARQSLIDGLSMLPESHHLTFKRMYANVDRSKSPVDYDTVTIEQVVQSMPVEKLDWAMKQVENSLKKQSGDTQS